MTWNRNSVIDELAAATERTVKLADQLMFANCELGKRDAQIARMQVLYESSLKTIADRDELIKHLRERYDWLRLQCENAIHEYRVNADGLLDVIANIEQALKEPTP